MVGMAALGVVVTVPGVVIPKPVTYRKLIGSAPINTLVTIFKNDQVIMEILGGYDLPTPFETSIIKIQEGEEIKIEFRGGPSTPAPQINEVVAFIDKEIKAL